MSDTTSEKAGASASPEQMMSALFASLVMQHTNMALIFSGQAPNPQTGETAQDLEHAQYFIDLLEMLAVKTKGNLDKQEDALLKQSLTHARLSFVEAVNNPPQSAPAPSSPAADADDSASPPTDEQEMPVTEPVLPGENAAELESRKKFSKKY